MGARTSNYVAETRWGKWLDERLPIGRFVNNSFIDYPTPRNLNYLWTFGGILTLILFGQIATGVVLAMHYQPSATGAFNSIEQIRRDVNYGWMLRNFHAVGASMFFFAVYIHIFRGFYYGSYKAPREVLWILGVLIMLLMMATAFMGYTLPWGQMSFWGVTVITNLFSALDTIVNGLGTAVVEWLWGGYAVSGVTLNRFFSLHYLLPFVLAGVVGLHIWALHVVGQNNPTGLDLKEPTDCVPMHPYATSKDAVGIFAFLLLYAWFVFFVPDYLGHADNYIEANPLVTPPHIVPEWYFLPFYAILRAFTSSFLGIPLGQYAKLCGVVAMFSAVIIIAFAPWLDTSRIRSNKYRPIFKWFFWFFVFTCVALGYLGSKPAEGVYVVAAQIFTVCYFLFFLVAMPIVGLIETPRRLPRSITESVLGKGGAGLPSGAAAAPETR
ncbi:cytochrome b N-terminal domain-containing protein [Hyphomicrobium sp. B1]|jgi:ubiquinol-cytochrome c reductase cytochrome b subunit|uniref:cytochrome b n=1 Tax=unclassified Hyphomicrobium TaxID=2619925 RepID=UPI00391A0613